MKLKLLFIIFNIVIFSLMFTIFCIPFFYANGNFLFEFWKINWFLFLLFAILLIPTNVIFFKNKKIINALENEDWPALSVLLEEKVFNEKKITKRNIKLLLETLFLLGDFQCINRLENLLKQNKPKLTQEFAAQFAAVKMIAGNYDDLYEFCKTATAINPQDEWLNFYLGLSLQMKKEYRKCAEFFWQFSDSIKNDLIKVLCCYFVCNILKTYIKANPEEIHKKEEKIKDEIKNKYKKNTWQEYIQREKQEIYAIVLTKLIDQASNAIIK